MSLKPEHEYERDEIKFFSELGWFAALSVSVASIAPYIVGIFG